MLAARPQPGRGLLRRHRGRHQPALHRVAPQIPQPLPGRVVLDALGDDDQAERVGQVDGAADDLRVLVVDGQPGHEGAVDLQLADREPAQMDQRRVAGAEVVQRHLHAVCGEPGQGVGGALRVLQQHVLGDLQLERSRGHAVAGEAGGDAPREAGGVDVARGDVDRDGHEQALRPPAGDLGERRLQDVLREMRHQTGGLGDGDELVRGDPAALRMHPAHQGLQPCDLPVEADLGLVVQFDLARVQRPAEIAEKPEPVGGVAVPLGLVDLHARAVPLGLVHRDVRPAQQPFGVQGVVGVDGDPGAGLQDEGEPVEVERRGQLGDEMPGDLLGAGGGVGVREEDGELVAAEAGRLRAARQGEPQALRYLEQQPVPGQMAEGVVDRAEAVQVDEDQRGAGADGFGVLQRRPGPLQQPLAVGQPGQRVAQLLLGAGAGDPERGVQGDQRHREERQQDGHGHRDGADQRGEPEERDGDEPLAQHRGPGDGRQPAVVRGLGVPQQDPGDEQIRRRGQEQFRDGRDAPVEWPPGLLDGGDHAERGQHERRRADAEHVDPAVQQPLPPAVPAGGPDEHHDGEADQDGRQPAVQQEHGEGEGGAGAGAAPPAVAAEGHQMADDDPGEHGEGPADHPVREERLALLDGPVGPDRQQ
ncbi:hypothetical protein P376_4633 [Streptomyces sp. HCCB10043]|nr:hypothetical protein P376_4633 [Streptomyces sp. HCCB10043]